MRVHDTMRGSVTRVYGIMQRRVYRTIRETATRVYGFMKGKATNVYGPMMEGGLAQ